MGAVLTGVLTLGLMAALLLAADRLHKGDVTVVLVVAAVAGLLWLMVDGRDL